MAKEPLWLNAHHVMAFHIKQIREHGGSHGMRDKHLLDSALAKPKNLFNYKQVTVFELAASYAYGIIKNHPFIDGNKRTAIIAAAVFLIMNGFKLLVSEPELVKQVIALADSSQSEKEFSEWLATNSKSI